MSEYGGTDSEAALHAMDEAEQKSFMLIRLRQALEHRRLVIITGTGVTQNATGYVPGTDLERLTWKGLIHHGLRYLERECRPPSSNVAKVRSRERQIKIAREILDEHEANNHIYAASILRDELQAEGQYPTWLSTVFGSLQVRQDSILRSLKMLHSAGATLLTTNYDHVLDEYCGLPSLSGTSDLLKFRRGRFIQDGVFHIHGSYKEPQSVVLDLVSYSNAKRDPEMQSYLQKCFQDDVVLFVGCGNGLDDLNFKALLEWITNKHAHFPHTHYRLATNEDENQFQPLIRLKYGREYSELGPWLENNLLETADEISSVVHRFTKSESDVTASTITRSNTGLVERLNSIQYSQDMQVDREFASPSRSDTGSGMASTVRDPFELVIELSHRFEGGDKPAVIDLVSANSSLPQDKRHARVTSLRLADDNFKYNEYEKYCSLQRRLLRCEKAICLIVQLKFGYHLNCLKPNMVEAIIEVRDLILSERRGRQTFYVMPPKTKEFKHLSINDKRPIIEVKLSADDIKLLRDRYHLGVPSPATSPSYEATPWLVRLHNFAPPIVWERVVPSIAVWMVKNKRYLPIVELDDWVISSRADQHIMDAEEDLPLRRTGVSTRKSHPRLSG